MGCCFRAVGCLLERHARRTAEWQGAFFPRRVDGDSPVDSKGLHQEGSNASLSGYHWVSTFGPTAQLCAEKVVVTVTGSDKQLAHPAWPGAVLDRRHPSLAPSSEKELKYNTNNGDW